MMKESEQSDS